MSLGDSLRNAAQATSARARATGLPVDRAQKLFDDRFQPWLVKQLSRYAIGFVRRTGVRVLAVEPGRVVCEMPLKSNTNHIGTMYAGALFTLAEFPGGVLMLATYGMSRFIPIVTELDIVFERAAKSDITIELRLSAEEIQRIEAETLANGRADFVLTGALTDRSGAVVARSTGRYQMRPRRR